MLTFVVSWTEHGLRLGMATGSLFAAILDLYRLDDAVGSKPAFGLVDRLAVLILGNVVAALLISVITHRLSKARNPAMADRIDTAAGATMLLVSVTLIVATVWSRSGLCTRAPGR